MVCGDLDEWDGQGEEVGERTKTLGSALLTHRAEEAPGVCHHSQEVFEVHVTISCGGQKNTEWTGAFQSRLGHCNPGTAVSIYWLELIIKVTHS